MKANLSCRTDCTPPADSTMIRCNSSAYAIDLAAVEEAANRIAPYVCRTPLLPSERLSKLFSADVLLKAECLQHSGAFKARGATNAVFTLTQQEADRGVVTHSSGNHAAAVARAAHLRGARAWVVMPRDASPRKVANVKVYGVEPIMCDPTVESRMAEVDRIRSETAATLIHPYNDPAVIAGQGTVGLEILDQGALPDAVIVPVGGGGLLSGVLTAIKSLRPQVQVVAAEPSLADDAYRSLRSGKIEPVLRTDTIADGLRTPLGSLTFPIIRDLVDDLVLVSEASIAAAADLLARHASLVVEPSGAVSLAALLEDRERFAGRRVVAVVSGGNAA